MPAAPHSIGAAHARPQRPPFPLSFLLVLFCAHPRRFPFLFSCAFCKRSRHQVSEGKGVGPLSPACAQETKKKLRNERKISRLNGRGPSAAYAHPKKNRANFVVAKPSTRAKQDHQKSQQFVQSAVFGSAFCMIGQSHLPATDFCVVISVKRL
nr:hypothetical protein [Pandoravirus massiliensis]